MAISKFQVKVFAERETHAEDYVPVFHRWIRDGVLDELMIDVVDYSHVQDGPVVVLIGHDSDYSLDRGGGQLGLLYANKRKADVTVARALGRALSVAALVAQEAGPKEPIRFRTDELLVRVADRLFAPNTDDTYERLLPELRAALTPLYGENGFELSRVGAGRELFTVRVRASNPPSFDVLRERASASAA